MASSAMHNPVTSTAAGLSSYNRYSTAAAINGNSSYAGLNMYNPFQHINAPGVDRSSYHVVPGSSTATSYLHLTAPLSYPSLTHTSYKRSSASAPLTGYGLAEETEPSSSVPSTTTTISTAAIDRILSLSMDSKSTYQSLQHLLGSNRGTSDFPLMPLDCGFDGYTSHPQPTSGAPEGYTYFNGPAVRSALAGLDPTLRAAASTPYDQFRDTKSPEHHQSGAMKNPFLSCSATSMDAALLHSMRLTNNFQLAHNSSLDMQLPSIPKMMRSKAKMNYAPLQSLPSKAFTIDQRQQRAIIPNQVSVPNATAAAFPENVLLSAAPRLSDNATSIVQERMLSSSLPPVAMDDTVPMCPMNLLALVSSFSKALDRPIAVEKDAVPRSAN